MLWVPAFPPTSQVTILRAFWKLLAVPPQLETNQSRSVSSMLPVRDLFSQESSLSSTPLRVPHNFLHPIKPSRTNTERWAWGNCSLRHSPWLVLCAWRRGILEPARWWEGPEAGALGFQRECVQPGVFLAQPFILQVGKLVRLRAGAVLGGGVGERAPVGIRTQLSRLLPHAACWHLAAPRFASQQVLSQAHLSAEP